MSLKNIFSGLQVQGLSFATLAILVVIIFFASSLLIRMRFARLRNIPGPALSKITNLRLGLHDLSYNRNNAIFDWHRQHGPVVCIAPNEVSVATLEATKVVYGTKYRWAKSNYFDLFKGFNMRSVFATKPYEAHRTKRKLISAFYQASNIYAKPNIEAYIQQRCRVFMKQLHNGQAVDVYALTDRFGFDIITYLVFGPDHVSCSTELDCEEREILMELKKLQFFNLLRVRFPGLLRPLDERYIAAEILDNINAAEATTAVTATYLIWRLTQNPVWQYKIREELAALPKQDDGTVSFSDVNVGVPSLEACLREVYRLHPASSGRAERVVPQGGAELSGFHLPEGTVVSTSVVALHRDESIFPDADSFLPERWLDADKTTLDIREAQLIPFGYGGRICLGKALATMEIKLLAANLYLKYQTEPTEMTSEDSMRQCSTHDAVPLGVACMIRCDAITQD